MSEQFARSFLKARRIVDEFNLFDVFTTGEQLLYVFLASVSRSNLDVPHIPLEITGRIAAELEEDDLKTLAELYYIEQERIGNQAQLAYDEERLRVILIHGGILALLEEYGAEYTLWQLDFTKRIVENGDNLDITLVYDNPDDYANFEDYSEAFSISTRAPADIVEHQLHQEMATVTNDKYDELKIDYMNAATENEDDFLDTRARGKLILNGVDFENVRFI